MKDEGGRVKKDAKHIESGKQDSSEPAFHPSSFILHPSKRRFGQNVLVDQNVVDRIITAVQPAANETIIEIGPGRGGEKEMVV